MLVFGIRINVNHTNLTVEQVVGRRKKLLEELKAHPFDYAKMQAIQADFCKVWLGLACGGSSDFCKGRRATTTRYDRYMLLPLHATTTTRYYRHMLLPLLASPCARSA